MSNNLPAQLQNTEALTLRLVAEGDKVLLEDRKRRRVSSALEATAAFRRPRLEAVDDFWSIPERDEPQFQLPAWLTMLDDEGIFRNIEHDLTDAFLISYKSSHPALRGRDTTFNAYRRAWAVVPSEGPEIPLFIAGYPVHLIPSDRWCAVHTTYADGPREYPFKLGPSTWPDDETLKKVCSTFPESTGMRVMKAGYIDILYESKSAAMRAMYYHDDKQYKMWIEDPVTGFASFIRFCVQPHREPTSSGDMLCLGEHTSYEHPARMPRGCIGAKILMNGQEYFTTVTHALVNYKTGKPGLWERIKRSFQAIRYPRIEMFSMLNGEQLVGTSCYVAGSDKNSYLGRIAKSYDAEKDILTYPADFKHDLCLISATGNTPDVKFIGYNLPVIQPKFKSPQEVWSSGATSCYIARYDVIAESAILYSGSTVQPKVLKSLLDGVGIAWPASSAQKVLFQRSFLWRTESIEVAHQPSPTLGNEISVKGASGSLLCLGQPDQVAAHGVVFQNFEEALLVPSVHALSKAQDVLRSSVVKNATIKGGFVLPKEVQESTILFTPTGRQSTTVPKPKVVARMSGTVLETRPYTS